MYAAVQHLQDARPQERWRVAIKLTLTYHTHVAALMRRGTSEFVCMDACDRCVDGSTNPRFRWRLYLWKAADFPSKVTEAETMLKKCKACLKQSSTFPAETEPQRLDMLALTYQKMAYMYRRYVDMPVDYWYEK